MKFNRIFLGLLLPVRPVMAPLEIRIFSNSSIRPAIRKVPIKEGTFRNSLNECKPWKNDFHFGQRLLSGFRLNGDTVTVLIIVCRLMNAARPLGARIHENKRWPPIWTRCKKVCNNRPSQLVDLRVVQTQVNHPSSWMTSRSALSVAQKTL